MSQIEQLKNYRRIVDELNLLNRLVTKTDLEVIVKNSIKLEVPTILVIGSKNIGKTKVVENLIGMGSIMPNSSTKVPILIKLRSLKSTEEQSFTVNIKGTSKHRTTKKLQDISLILEEYSLDVEQLYSEMTTSDKMDPPIHLTIKSDYAWDVDIIDTAAILESPALHSSLKSIESQNAKTKPNDSHKEPKKALKDSNRQIVEYVASKTSCLILAVNSASSDLATSDSLKFAKRLDPSTSRTIGIITKIDLMDEATDCVSILNNQVYNLKRGFVGIVNSSTENIKSFFTSNNVYSSIANKQGPVYLKKLCIAVLIKIIKQETSKLTVIIKEISMIIQKKKLEEIKKMALVKEEVERDENKIIKLILDMSSYFKTFDLEINERGRSGHVQDLRYYLTSPGAKIFREILVVFPTSLEKYKITIKDILDLHLKNIDIFKSNKHQFLLKFKHKLHENNEKIYKKCMERVANQLIAYIIDCINKMHFKDSLKSFLIEGYQSSIKDYQISNIKMLELLIKGNNCVDYNDFDYCEEIFDNLERYESSRMLSNEATSLILDKLGASKSKLLILDEKVLERELIDQIVKDKKFIEITSQQPALQKYLVESIIKVYFDYQFASESINRYTSNLMLKGIVIKFIENFLTIGNQLLLNAYKGGIIDLNDIQESKDTKILNYIMNTVDKLVLLHSQLLD